MTLRIEDYALIGDCKTAALVGRDGSIDWLCWPRFDSAACFAALLGTVENGRWILAPQQPIRAVRRRYRPGTLVLETEFQTETGRAAIVDFMPPADGAHLVRIVVGRSGRVDFRNEFVVRFNYGATVPWVSRLDDGSIDAIAGPERLILRTPAALYGEDLRTIGEFTVEAGGSVPFVLSYGSSQSPQPSIDPYLALTRTLVFWRQWSNRCPDVGPWSEAVRGSLTLKALIYAPTGGMVAAATTSLPERLGGVRNWDYQLLLAARRHLHAARLHATRVSRRGARVARLAHSRCRRQPEADPDHVQRGRGALASGNERALALRLREFFAGADWKFRARAAAARCFWRDRGRDVSGAQVRHGDP
jgi:GH15 family glucan-1,4-alpha-glucosidase